MKQTKQLILAGLVAGALAWGGSTGRAQPVLTPGVDYTKPNFAYSPPLRKFVDALPGLTSVGSNNLGQYIPIAVANTPYATAAGDPYPGSHYYEIGLVDYFQKMHSDLPGTGTKLRGYVQLVPSTYPGAVPLDTAHGLATNILDPVTGLQLYAADQPRYLGPLIIGVRDVPVRILFRNLLGTGPAGDLFLPVDTTLMGSGNGPLQIGTDPVTGQPLYEQYTQNRATIHLHGGLPPWVSDGTALQWITPAGDPTSYKKGASQENVPDMTVPPDGSMTFYFPNQQSGRLMFYHDHAVGITRFVYAGMAAGYLLVDPAEEDMLAAAGVPGTIGTTTANTDLGHLLPLVIQDKTFVPDNNTLATLDPLWDTNKWGGPGNLWFPHIYMPNQDPTSLSGANPLGRWDYGPWFWPPWPVPAGSTPPVVSHVPEAFMDTPLVNGTAYPYANVQPAKYRLRILNAANDRMLNLQLYVADPAGYAIDATGAPVTPGTGFGTEVAMIAAYPNTNVAFPPLWKTQTPGMIPDVLDSRVGGVPNPTNRGPAMIQIGTEGGLLPNPVLQLNTPVGYEQNKRNIVVLNVNEKTLLLAPAERADIIVDFSKFAGKTVILYNDAPAPVPAQDPRYDFYTGNPDMSATAGVYAQGGPASTLPGMGPNTRTIMQFRVAAGPDSSSPPDDYDPVLLAALQDPAAGLPTIFKTFQPTPIVPESAYNTLGLGARPDTYVRIQSNYVSYIPYGSVSAITAYMQPKCIQELFDPIGRMNATLGVELPFTGAPIQTTIPLGFTDPATEIFNDGELQLWKITHNGVDTHGIHFHLVNVQVVNRVGWDGAIRPPDANELGWKDTVRMNPLEDIIVAMQATTPKVPFGCPQSIRPLSPAIPLGSAIGFEQIDPLTGNPKVVTNSIANLDWEYTWHCHILGHEENDMMRPVILNFPVVIPTAPVLAATLAGTVANLAWTDATPPSNPATYGNPGNEVGFRIEQATVTGGVAGPYSIIATNPANAINYNGATVAAGAGALFRVSAFNPAGSAASNPVFLGPPPVISTTTLPNGEVTVAYSQTVAGSGGLQPYNWSIAAGTLPGGLTLTPATGVLSGTPTTAGTFNFTMQLTDALGTAVTQALSITVVPLPSVATTTLPNGEVTVAYSQTLAVSGGISPYTWTRSAGTLPGGLTLSAAGVISGTPTTVGTFNFTVRVTDAAAKTATRALSITVVAAPSVTTATLPNGIVGTAYSQALAASAGTTPYTWSVSVGVLPGGLALSATGIISGTPTTVGTFNFTVRVTDAAGGTGVKALSITVTGRPPGAPTGLTAVVQGPPLSVALTWVAPAAPDNVQTGFRIERAAGTAGVFALLTTVGSNVTTYSDTTVAANGTYRYRVYATNSAGNSATPAGPVTVTTPPMVTSPPRNVFAASSAISTNLPSVTVTWNDPVGGVPETGFRITRALDAGFTVGVTTFTVAANATTFTDTTVAPSTTYYYWVQEFNQVGYNPGTPTANTTASVKTVAQLTVPAAPSALSAVATRNGGSDRVTLSWTDNANNETSFTVQQALNATFTSGLVSRTVGANTITLQINNLARGTAYYFRIQANNGAGSSAWANATPFPVTTP